MVDGNEIYTQVTNENWRDMVIALVKKMKEPSDVASDDGILEFISDFMTPIPTNESVTVWVKVADEGGDTYVIVPNNSDDYSRQIRLQLPTIKDGNVGQVMNTILFLYNIWSHECKEPIVLYEIIPHCLFGIAKDFWEMIKLRAWASQLPILFEFPTHDSSDSEDDKFFFKKDLPLYTGVDAMRELIAMLLTKQQRIQFKDMMTDLRRPVGMSIENFMERIERLSCFLHLMVPDAHEPTPEKYPRPQNRHTLSGYMEYLTWKNMDDELKNEYVKTFPKGCYEGSDASIKTVNDSVDKLNHSIHFTDVQHVQPPIGRIYQFVKRVMETEIYSRTVFTKLEDFLQFDNVLNIDYTRHQCVLPLLQPPTFRIETSEGMISKVIQPVPPITGECLECMYINKTIFMRVHSEIKNMEQEDSLDEWWENTMVQNCRASEVWRRWKKRDEIYINNRFLRLEEPDERFNNRFPVSWRNFNKLMISERKKAAFDDMLVNLSLPNQVQFSEFFERCNELWDYRLEMPYYKGNDTSTFVAMLWRNISDEWKQEYVNQRQPAIGLDMFSSLINRPHKTDWTWLYRENWDGQRILTEGEHGMVYSYIEKRVQQLLTTTPIVSAANVPPNI